MELSTTTSTTIHDFILTILIFLSDLSFRWIPAVITVITGQPPAFADLRLGAVTAAHTANTVAQQATQVAVQGTHIDTSGVETSIPVDGSIQAVQATSAAAPHISAFSFVSDTLQTAWHVFAPLSIFISLLLAMGLVYSMIRFFQIRFAEKQALHTMAQALAAPTMTVVAGVPVKAGPTDAEKRWKRIQEQIASDSENDWRLAILESDIMLGDALTARRYVGESIGEQLKGLTRGDLTTLDQAWDAHKVRNHIAHRGSTHDLNQREARRVIAEYGQVFKELELI